MESVDVNKLKEEIIVSKKSNRVSTYFGEVILFLVTRQVNKEVLFQDKDEDTGEVILIVMEKLKVYLKAPGKLVVRGYKPKQVLKYVIGMVNFSILEHKNFIYSKYKRQVRGKDPTFIGIDSIVEVGEMPIFDIMLDYCEEINEEEMFIKDLYND